MTAFGFPPPTPSLAGEAAMRRGLLVVAGLALAALASWWLGDVSAAPADAAVQWVWFDEGDPVKEAPAATRYFRRTFTINRPTQIVVDDADLDITADNAFTVWVNGIQVGKGDDWKRVFRFD